MSPGKKLFLWISLGGTLICCIGVTTPLWIMINGKDNLQGAVQDYRKVGLPWTRDEVQPKVNLPESENAAPIISTAEIDVNGTERSAEIANGWRYAVDRNDAAVQAILTKYAHTLDLAKLAAGKRFADFHKDWDFGPDVTFTELSATKSLVRLLTLRALYAAQHGNFSSCMADLGDGWRLATLVGKEPTVISLLVEIAAWAIIDDAVQHVTFELRNNQSGLSALKSEVAKMTGEPDFGLAIRGEAYMGLAILRNGSVFRNRVLRPNEESPPPVDPRSLQRTGNPSGIIERVLGGKLLRTYIEEDEIGKKDRGNLVQLDKDLAALDQELEADHSINGLYRQVLAPVFSATGSAILRAKATRMLTAALVDAVLAKARTGAYPKSVNDLPGDWTDPFGGNPLHMKQVGSQIRIYSVGPDLVDNGGFNRTEMSGKNTDQFDIVAACPPIPGKKVPPKASPNRSRRPAGASGAVLQGARSK